MRRVLLLAALATAAGLGVLLVPAPRQLSGPESVRGPSVLRVHAGEIRAISVRVETRTFAATRTDGGWLVGDRPAPPPLAEAIDALVAMLTGLRAVDAFRAADRTEFGLDAPRAIVVVDTPRGVRTMRLGRVDSSGSTIYASREGDPRVFRVGIALVSAIDRVLYQAAQAEAPPP